MKIIKSENYKNLIYAARRGTFKYKCDECGESTFLSSMERNRVSIPRCRFCGSTWLEPVAKETKNRVQDAQEASRDRANSMREKQNF